MRKGLMILVLGFCVGSIHAMGMMESAIEEWAVEFRGGRLEIDGQQYTYKVLVFDELPWQEDVENATPDEFDFKNNVYFKAVEKKVSSGLFGRNSILNQPSDYWILVTVGRYSDALEQTTVGITNALSGKGEGTPYDSAYPLWMLFTSDRKRVYLMDR